MDSGCGRFPVHRLKLAPQASHDSLIRQLRKMCQQVVVCKTPAPAFGSAEVLRLSKAEVLFARSSNRCLPSRPCCFPGFERLPPGAFRDNASSNPGSRCAISGNCRGIPGDILRLFLAFAGGIRSAAASGTPTHCKLSAEAGTSRAEKLSHKSGNAVLPYGALSHPGKRRRI